MTDEDKQTDPLDEEKQRISRLQDPNLLYNIVKEVQKEGVIGEEPTILVLTNKILLKNTINSKPTSSNLIISDETSGGKDYIVSRVCDILVQKDRYFHLTDISDKVFDYWKPITGWDTNDKGKKTPVFGSWNGFVIHLEDPREDAINGQSFKVMSSGGTNVVKVIDNKAQHTQIDGKPVIIVTSLKTLVDNEGLRRWDTQRIDTSIEQTTSINKYKLLKASNKIKNKPDWILRDALHFNLGRKNVLIPFATELYDLLPCGLVSRTLSDKLLDYIRSSAVLYQYQREKKDNNTIIATGDDLYYGWYVFTTLNQNQGIPLNKDEEELIKILIEKQEPLPISELSNLYTRHSKQWLYLNKEKFVNKGLIKTVYEFDNLSNKEIEKITFGNNSNLVLKGFKEVLKYNNIFSFIGFNGFQGIFERLEKNRLENDLKSVFGLTNSLKPLKPLKPIEKQGLQTIGKPFKTKDMDGRSNSVATDNNIKDVSVFLPKIIEVMKTKPKTEWKINDICFSLGIANLSTRKQITCFLEQVTSDPKNNTGIQRVDESGLFWRLKDV